MSGTPQSTGSLSFTIRDSRTDALGDKLSQDRLRIVAANVAYDFADGWGGSNLLTAELSKGLDLLNATESGSANLTRSGGRSDFRKLLVSAQRNQPLTDSLVLALSGEAQYSPDQLLSSEEYGLGGKQYGRAFDPSEITGDSGFAAHIGLDIHDAWTGPGSGHDAVTPWELLSKTMDWPVFRRSAESRSRR